MGLVNLLKNAVVKSIYHRPDQKAQKTLNLLDKLLVDFDPELETIHDRVQDFKRILYAIENLPEGKIVKVASETSDTGHLLLKPTKYGLEVSKDVIDLLDI